MRVIGKKAQIYVAHPTRIHKQDKLISEALKDTRTIERIKRFLRKRGFSPMDPFGCGDYEDFEGGPVGRKDTLEWTFYLQRYHWWSAYCGWSEGVMKEFFNRLEWDPERRMRVFYEDDAGVPFDPLWEEEYQRWSKIFDMDPLAELRGRNKIFQFVGSTAVGKTYAMKQLLKAYPETLKVVLNTTTRPHREEDDNNFYRLVSKEEFLEQKDNLDFIETDEHSGNYYGSSLSDTRKALRDMNGIHAMTPAGATAWHKECRFDFNLVTVLFTAPPEVLKRNLERRGILGQQEQEKIIQKASKFVLPQSVPHLKLEMTGMPIDKERILDLLSPLLK